MQIRKYGIVLERLKQRDIELVRQMRNSAAIQQTMLFREQITPEQQLKWFHSINNIYNNYYIIIADGKKIGLVNGKNVDYDDLSSEGGIFIWDPDYINHIVAPACSVIMNDHAFRIIGFKKSYIKVLRSNTYGMQYNKMMGYVPAEDKTSDERFLWMVLHAHRYEQYNARIRKAIEVLTGDTGALTLDNIYFDGDTDEELKQLYSPLPGYIRQMAQKILDRTGRKLPQ